MLQLTESAAAALESIRRAEAVPESHETRLTGGQQRDGEVEVHLEFVESRNEDDQVTALGGTEVLIAPEVAEPLSDAVLDVQDGVTGPSFVFLPQTPGDPTLL